MIKLADILKEVQEVQDIKYTKPNFEFEWEEAGRYPEFTKMGKEGWIEIANNGHTIKYSKIKNVLGNVDLEFDTLLPDRKKRFDQAYKSGIIEMPLVVKFSDNNYDLIGGNTRLAGLVSKGVDPTLWVVNLATTNPNKLSEMLNEVEEAFLSNMFGKKAPEPQKQPTQAPKKPQGKEYVVDGVPVTVEGISNDGNGYRVWAGNSPIGDLRAEEPQLQMLISKEGSHKGTIGNKVYYCVGGLADQQFRDAYFIVSAPSNNEKSEEVIKDVADQILKRKQRNGINTDDIRDILNEVEIDPLKSLKSELEMMATSWNRDQKAVAVSILKLNKIAQEKFQKSYDELEYAQKTECLQQAKDSITDLSSFVNQIDKLVPTLKGMQYRIAASLVNRYKAKVQPLAEGKKEEPKLGAFEEFAGTREKGAEKIANNAKEKGGPSMLTYHHFHVKLPYYKKAAEGKLDLEAAHKEYKDLLKQLHTATKTNMNIEQIAFQKLVGKIEVLGELLIKHK